MWNADREDSRKEDAKTGSRSALTVTTTDPASDVRERERGKKRGEMWWLVWGVWVVHSKLQPHRKFLTTAGCWLRAES